MDTLVRLQELIDERNLTITELARISGVRRSTLQTAMQRGSQLTVPTIERICQALGITLAEFFTSRGEQAPAEYISSKQLSEDELQAIREMIAERNNKK